MPANILDGDILNCDSKYIIHQCNCISRGSAGLAYQIFSKFPYANIYSTRIGPSIPGKIYIAGNGEDQRFIINSMSQFLPGGPSDYYLICGLNDSEQGRIELFKKCLRQVQDIQNLESIAFPWRYGCGIAGGDWNIYNNLINEFADNNKNIKVTIIKRPEDD